MAMVFSFADASGEKTGEIKETGTELEPVKPGSLFQHGELMNGCLSIGFARVEASRGEIGMSG